MNTGLSNVNPMALVGNLVGAMVGQMAAGGQEVAWVHSWRCRGVSSNKGRVAVGMVGPLAMQIRE